MILRGKTFDRIDIGITRWMAAKGIFLLRISVGIIFFWFGFLKFFEGFSPAEEMATKTIRMVTFGILPDSVILYGLASMEVWIGIGLIFKLLLRETLLILFIQMTGTFLPVFLFPGEVFHIFPYSLTIEGQYIVKNLVIISAGIVLGSTVRD